MIHPNWDQIVEEKSEEDQQKELKEKAEKQKNKDCKDGYIETWRKKFTYMGIDFELSLARYFDHTMKFKPIMSRRISDKQAFLEYIKGDELVERIRTYLDGFLWEDTLHSYNDKQNRNEQLDAMYNSAIAQISSLEENLQTKIYERDKEIKNIQALREEIWKQRHLKDVKK